MVLTLAAVGLSLLVGYVLPQRPMVVVGGVALILVAVAGLAQPLLLPLLAMPFIVVGARVGGGGLDLPLGTLMLGLAFLPAVVFAARPFSPTLLRMLWLNAVYQAATLFTLVANPFLANGVDWFHSWMIVSGALVTGWAVGRGGAATLGVRLFLGAVVVIAVLGVGQGLMRYAQGNFAALFPSLPFPMHKNFFGTLVCFGALIFFARPSWLRMGKGVAVAGFLICVAAMGVSQSRQAIVALAVGLLLIAIKGRGERRRAWLGALIGIPALYFVATLVREQIVSGNQHNSFFQRLTWYGDSIDKWRESPVFGNGLRYWTQPQHPGAFQPPQVFFEVLATAGIVGLVGFLIMAAGFVVVLWRVPGLTGSIALALVVARLVQGQLDLYWVAPTTAIPFLLTGVFLGVLERQSVQVHPERARVAVGAERR
ncbi:O-antigen ligase family protein [Ornithinimicrobium cerasi]|uniref:O-antigen ligase family protein n=1 Tax=Ornithinimicrobium cerasi TaxID=2248773 RepID=UPI0014836EC0|nr:O-antigen ligase family protein [Ornithinimicrobium cerasi]